jgi:hypothetical protein
VSLLGRVQVLSSVDELMEGREEQQQEPLFSLLPYTLVSLYRQYPFKNA